MRTCDKVEAQCGQTQGSRQSDEKEGGERSMMEGWRLAIMDYSRTGH